MFCSVHCSDWLIFNHIVKFAIVCPLTFKHILIDCICFGAARQRYLGVDTLKELFENVESCNIIAFINDANFFIIVYNVVFILA